MAYQNIIPVSNTTFDIRRRSLSQIYTQLLQTDSNGRIYNGLGNLRTNILTSPFTNYNVTLNTARNRYILNGNSSLQLDIKPFTLYRFTTHQLPVPVLTRLATVGYFSFGLYNPSTPTVPPLELTQATIHFGTPGQANSCVFLMLRQTEFASLVLNNDQLVIFDPSRPTVSSYRQTVNVEIDNQNANLYYYQGNTQPLQGDYTISGSYAHGISTEVSNISHAEGSNTAALASGSHVEGIDNNALPVLTSNIAPLTPDRTFLYVTPFIQRSDGVLAEPALTNVGTLLGTAPFVTASTVTGAGGTGTGGKIAVTVDPTTQKAIGAFVAARGSGYVNPITVSFPTGNGLSVNVVANQRQAILGNTQAENTLLQFCQDQGINSIILYDLNWMDWTNIATGTAASPGYGMLNAFITKARNTYNVDHVSAAIGFDSFASGQTQVNRIVNYNVNAQQTQSRNDGYFSGVTTEVEWWNDPSVTIQEVSQTLDYAKTAGRSLSQSFEINVYLGKGQYYSSTDPQQLAAYVDRWLVSTYTNPPANASYGLYELSKGTAAPFRMRDIANAYNALGRTTKVLPIFSAESKLSPWNRNGGFNGTNTQAVDPDYSEDFMGTYFAPTYGNKTLQNVYENWARITSQYYPADSVWDTETSNIIKSTLYPEGIALFESRMLSLSAPTPSGPPSPPYYDPNTGLASGSHLEGYNNTSTGQASHIEGSTNVEGGFYSHIKGLSNTNSGSYSYIAGQLNSNNASGSHLEGYSNFVGIQGQGSHVEGYENTSIGAFNHVAGESNAIRSAIRTNVQGASHNVGMSYLQAAKMTVTFGGPAESEYSPIWDQYVGMQAYRTVYKPGYYGIPASSFPPSAADSFLTSADFRQLTCSIEFDDQYGDIRAFLDQEVIPQILNNQITVHVPDLYFPTVSGSVGAVPPPPNAASASWWPGTGLYPYAPLGTTYPYTSSGNYSGIFQITPPPAFNLNPTQSAPPWTVGGTTYNTNPAYFGQWIGSITSTYNATTDKTSLNFVTGNFGLLGSLYLDSYLSSSFQLRATHQSTNPFLVSFTLPMTARPGTLYETYETLFNTPYSDNVVYNHIQGGSVNIYQKAANNHYRGYGFSDSFLTSYFNSQDVNFISSKFGNYGGYYSAKNNSWLEWLTVGNGYQKWGINNAATGSLEIYGMDISNTILSGGGHTEGGYTPLVATQLGLTQNSGPRAAVGAHAHGGTADVYGHAEWNGSAGPFSNAEPNAKTDGVASHGEGLIQSLTYGVHTEKMAVDSIVAGGTANHVHGRGGYSINTLANPKGAHIQGTTSPALNSNTPDVDGADYAHIETGGAGSAGIASHADGASVVTGPYAHAQGNATSATGAGSHAEGQQVSAVGAQSHAEGNNAASRGRYSHAQGDTSVAWGEGSHAEGLRTQAGVPSGSIPGVVTVYYMHTEGSGSLAIGTGSHAQGELTTASGNFSHAQGHLTKAVGAYGSAEGYKTINSGSYGFVAGSGSIVLTGENGLVLGNNNLAPDGSNAWIFGQNNTSSRDSSIIGGVGNVVDTANFGFTFASGSNINTQNPTLVVGQGLTISSPTPTQYFLLGKHNTNSTGEFFGIIANGDPGTPHDLVDFASPAFAANASQTVRFNDFAQLAELPGINTLQSLTTNYPPSKMGRIVCINNQNTSAFELYFDDGSIWKKII